MCVAGCKGREGRGSSGTKKKIGTHPIPPSHILITYLLQYVHVHVLTPTPIIIIICGGAAKKRFNKLIDRKSSTTHPAFSGRKNVFGQFVVSFITDQSKSATGWLFIIITLYLRTYVQ